MKYKYLFALQVQAVDGAVIFEVEAENEALAILAAKAGQGAFKYDNVKITKLGDPVLLGVAVHGKRTS
jgi:hypothetical protein